MNNEKRYTIKQIYKKEQKYKSMKIKDTDSLYKDEGIKIMELYAITSLTYPIMGIGAITNSPLWLTLSPLVINAVPIAMGVRLLFFRKRLYDLENELSVIHNNMSDEKVNELEAYTKKKTKEKKTVSQIGR